MCRVFVGSLDLLDPVLFLEWLKESTSDISHKLIGTECSSVTLGASHCFHTSFLLFLLWSARLPADRRGRPLICVASSVPVSDLKESTFSHLTFELSVRTLVHLTPVLRNLKTVENQNFLLTKWWK